MTPPHPGPPRWIDAGLTAASWLVPRTARDAWRREWRAEFASLTGLPADQRRGPSPRARFFMAVRHAMWLRWRSGVDRAPKGGRMLDRWRLAARALRREPSFFLPAFVTLALGIGATVAVFSVVEAVLLRPLPYPGASDLVLLRHHDLRTDLTKSYVARTDLLDIGARQHGFAHITPYGAGRTVLAGRDEPVEVSALVAGPDLFPMTGVDPLLGRGLTADDCRPDAAPVVVLTEEFWRAEFASDPGVVGRAITLGTRERQVVGVAPGGFRVPQVDLVDVILPMSLPGQPPSPRSVGAWVLAAARPRPGVSFAAANAELRELSAQLAAAYPATNRGTEYYSVSVRDGLTGSVQTPLWLLMAAAAVVLLIALVNVANLLLVRGLARQGELALRVALGAGRRRLFGQLLAEHLLLTGAAAAASIALAHWGTAALVALVPASVQVPALADAGVNDTVLAFAVGLTLLVACGFSVFGSVHVDRYGAARTLMSRTRLSMSRGARRTASTLVVIEVALAAALLVGAGLITRSFDALMGVDPGFDRRGVMTAALDLPASAYPNVESRKAFFARALPALEAAPGVANAGVAAVVPLTGNNWTVPFVRADRPPASGARAPDIGWQTASGGYFAALGIPVLSGRVFRPDDAVGPPVVVISESVAHRFFDPGEDPIGHRVKLDQDEAEIVGVVGDIRRASLIDEPRADMYLPFEFEPSASVTLFLKGVDGRTPDADVLRSALQAVEPKARLSAGTSMDRVALESAGSNRLVMWLLGTFSVIAMALAVIGVYGVMSYAVRRRRREFGTRIALGARAADIQWLVLRQGALIVATGVLLGLGAAFVAARALESLLFHVGTHDPATLATTALVLAAAGAAGCYVPARRASRIEPARTLVDTAE